MSQEPHSIEDLIAVGDGLFRFGVEQRLCLECDQRSANVDSRKAIRHRYSDLLRKANNLLLANRDLQDVAHVVVNAVYPSYDHHPTDFNVNMIKRFKELDLRVNVPKLDAVPKNDSLIWEGYPYSHIASFCLECRLFNDLVTAVCMPPCHAHENLRLLEPYFRSRAQLDLLNTSLRNWEFYHDELIWDEVESSKPRRRTSRQEIRKLYGVSPQTISKWIDDGEFPKPIDPGSKKHLYWMDCVEEAMDKKGIYPNMR